MLAERSTITEGTLTGRMLKGFLASLTTMLFVLALLFLLGLLLIPSLPPDERRFLKMAFAFLGPFSAVLWYITASNLVFHRRAGFLMQLVIFVGTAVVIYLLLISGVYYL
jgi:hypothetical protein